MSNDTTPKRKDSESSATALEVVKLQWKQGEKEFMTCRQVSVNPQTRMLILVQTDYVKRSIPLENIQWVEQALLGEDGLSALKFPEKEKTVLIEPDDPMDWPCQPFDEY